MGFCPCRKRTWCSQGSEAHVWERPSWGSVTSIIVFVSINIIISNSSSSSTTTTTTTGSILISNISILIIIAV